MISDTIAALGLFGLAFAILALPGW